MAGQVDPDIAESIAAQIARRVKKVGLDYRQDGKMILEPGCGQGFMMRALEQQFPEARVYGFDSDKVYVNIAKRLGRKVVAGDMNQMPIADQSVDMVVTSNVFDYANAGEDTTIDMQQTIPEIYRVLKVGGLYIASADQDNIERAIQYWPEAFAGFEHHYKNAIHIFVKR